MCTDGKNKIIYYNEKIKDQFYKNLKEDPSYVYKVTVPWKLVSRGHDISLDEYTLDIPVKAEEIIVTRKELEKYVNIKFISESECIMRSTEIYKRNGGKSYFHKPSIIKKLIYYPIESRRNIMNQYGDQLTRRKQERKKLNEDEIIHNNLLEIMTFHNSMKDFDYGFYSNGKKYTGDILDKEGTFNNYRLMPSAMIEKYKVCVCWDACRYEAEWFKKNLPNIPIKCYYCEYEPNIGNTHTWLTFKYNGDWYVFEYTWFKHRGIKKINIEKHLKEYIEDIPKADHSPTKLRNAKYVLFEYDPLKEPTGLTCNSFMNMKWEKGKFIKTNCSSNKELISTFQFRDDEIIKYKLDKMKIN